MRLVFGEDQHVAQWTANRIPAMAGSPFAPPFTAIGVADDAGAPLAGVVYSNYNPVAGVIEVSMAAASPRWARRGVIRALLHYPFKQLAVQKVFAVLPSTNTRALRFIEGIGFRREGVLARQFGHRPNVHAVIVRMFSEDYDTRYVQPKTARLMPPSEAAPSVISEMVH